MHKRRRGLSARSARRVHKKEYSEKALLELLSEHGELPQSYAEKRIVMIPVDPHMVHVYWEISPEEIADALCRFNGDALKYRPVLRFYQLNPERGGSRFFDVDIHLGANNWYVHLQHPDMLCCVQLGFRHDCGGLLVLISSEVHLSARVSGHEAAFNIKKGIVCTALKPSAGQTQTLILVNEKQLYLDKGCEFLSSGYECHCGEYHALTSMKMFDSGDCAIMSRNGEALHGLTELCERSFASGVSSR